MENVYDKIENMQEQDYFVVDIFHNNIEGNRFFELEKFYLKNYLDEFEKKLCKIVAQIICKYEVEIYLTEFPDDTKKSEYVKLVGKNIADMKLEDIISIVAYVIKNDISSVQILVPEYNFLFSINGEFQVSVYNIVNKQKEFVTEIVEKEGLYFYQPE